MTVTISLLRMPPRRKRGAKATKRVQPGTVHEEPAPKRHRGAVDKQRRSGESAANCRSDDVLPGAEQDHDSEEVGS